MVTLTFYFDRNFGKRFPQALAHMKPPFSIEGHHSKSCNFPHNMPDDKWLEICGINGWIVFSHDQKFHTIATEAMAVKQHSVGCFYLPGASEQTFNKMQFFFKAYPKIVTLAASSSKPFLYRVMPSGKVLSVKLP